MATQLSVRSTWRLCHPGSQPGHAHPEIGDRTSATARPPIPISTTSPSRYSGRTPPETPGPSDIPQPTGRCFRAGKAALPARHRHLADGRVAGGADGRRVVLPSARKTIMEVYDAAAKAMLVQQVEFGVDAGG